MKATASACLMGALLWLVSGECSAAEPRDHYMIHCMGCHGEDGAGLPGAVPDLRRDFARLVSSGVGRDYILRLPGVNQAGLDAQDTASVLNWILENLANPVGNSSQGPFTAAEILAARRQPLLELSALRASILGEARDSADLP
ncbi:MAG: c-type cytochrome [Steroidobacteraceae bacterium]